jgi:hypothetical protein
LLARFPFFRSFGVSNDTGENTRRDVIDPGKTKPRAFASEENFVVAPRDRRLRR